MRLCAGTACSGAPDQSADVALRRHRLDQARPFRAPTSRQGTRSSRGLLPRPEQVDPKNTNIDVRVLSPGDNGSVSQSNSVKSEADASNRNSTSQTSHAGSDRRLELLWLWEPDGHPDGEADGRQPTGRRCCFRRDSGRCEEREPSRFAC